MTVEKVVVVGWQQTLGCSTDDERRALAETLARKRARFAFPDDFTFLVQKLKGRLQEKHNKQSPEGEALRSLREIRVRAAPGWDASHVEITFLFIYDENFDVPPVSREELMSAWLQLVPNEGRYHVQGFLTTIDDITARDYIESDPLDLDYLSGSR